jgi:hypothetical protein
MTSPDRGAERPPVTVAVHPGTGVIARHADAVLVIPAVEPGQWPQTQRLLDISSRGPDASARTRTRAVAALLSEAEPEEVPGFALLLGLDAEVTVLAHGAVEVTVAGAGQESFCGTDSLAWVERHLPGPLTYLHILAAGTAANPDSGPAPFHLEAGIVPGSGVSVHRAEPPEAAPPAQPGTTPSAADVTGPVPLQQRPVTPVMVPPGTVTGATVARPVLAFESVPLGGHAGHEPDHRRPLPVGEPAESAALLQSPDDAVLVEGVDCPSGHFNDPSAPDCAICGAPLAGPAQAKVRRPRPVLGVLVTDNGSVFSLAGDYVLGRAPERDEAVLSGQARPLVLRDVGQSVSRIHARLTLSGWRVLLSDRGSANGTFVSHSGLAGPWERVLTDSTAVLAPGDRLRIGGRQLVFESYRADAAPPREGGR